MFCYFSSNLVFINLINNKLKELTVSAILGCIFSHSRSIYFKNFPGEHAPDPPPRSVAPAARAKNASGILFSPSPSPIAKMLRGPCIKVRVEAILLSEDNQRYVIVTVSLPLVRFF